MLAGEAAAWEHSRNKNHVEADWQFTAANARVKLKRLYFGLVTAFANWRSE